MSILSFIIVVVIVGLVLWLVNAFIPMEAGVKKFLNIAVVILLVLWFLSVLGVFPELSRPIIITR